MFSRTGKGTLRPVKSHGVGSLLRAMRRGQEGALRMNPGREQGARGCARPHVSRVLGGVAARPCTWTNGSIACCSRVKSRPGAALKPPSPSPTPTPALTHSPGHTHTHTHAHNAQTSKRNTLSQYTKRTLGSGNLRAAVALPENEEKNEWLAANTVDFFNEISLLYGASRYAARGFSLQPPPPPTPPFFI